MAETQPFMLQGLCYSYAEMRAAINRVAGEGVANVAGGDLLVASTGAGDHSVTVAAGVAYVQGNDDADQGFYRVSNDAPVTLQLAAGNGVNPRVDTIVATVRDAQYGGTDNDWYLQVVAGTASGSAALTDAGIAASAAAVPANSVVLGYVLVGAADTLATTILAGSILDARSNFDRQGAEPYCSLEASAGSLIGSGVFAQNTLAVVQHCDREYFSVSGSTITVLKPGLYRVSAGGGWSAIGTGGAVRTVSVYKNNTNAPNASPDGTSVADNRTGPVTTFFATPNRDKVPLTAGDTLKLLQSQDTGGAVNSIGSAYLTVSKVG